MQPFKSCLFGLSSALICVGAGAIAQETVINITSPGGSVQTGGRAALWGPAAEKLGLAVREETVDAGLAATRLQVASGAVTTDIVFLGSFEGELAGREGILEPIDYSVIDRSKFLPGTATDYCVGVYGYATVMAWNPEAFPTDGQPQTWADFYDTEKFPGARALRQVADAQLEGALLADGVAPEDIYAVLSTDEGVERALNVFRKVKPSVSVWWSTGAQHAQLMKDGEVEFATGWNGRFQNAKNDGGSVAYTFNQGILATDCLAIPKGAPNKDLAMKMIAEMSTAEAQANLTKYITYGPVIPEAFDLGIIDPETARLLPTHPDYLSKLIVQDIGWWVENGEAVTLKYEAMVSE